MTTNLTEQIEKLVRDHFVASRAAVAAAVERAFAAASVAAGGHAQPTLVTSTRTRKTMRAKPAPRRAAEEVVALGEEFYAVLCRSPCSDPG